MSISFRKILSLILIGSLIQSCTGWQKASNEYLKNYVEETNEFAQSLDKYLGKSPQEIEATFGKPKVTSLTPASSSNVPYDEMMLYQQDQIGYSGDFEFSCRFFFKDDRLIRVDAG